MPKKIAILLLLILFTGLGCNKKEISKAPESPVDVLKQEKMELRQAIQTAAANDQDIDGLTDEEEVQLKTDKGLADTDGDGLSDYDEIKTFKTNPLKPDTDSDGKVDGYEVRRGLNPLVK